MDLSDSEVRQDIILKKKEMAELRRERKKKQKKIRKMEKGCFWTWPWGHMWKNSYYGSAYGSASCLICNKKRDEW